MLGIPEDTVRRLRSEYPAGTRVELVKMDDAYRRMDAGEKGTVKSVDDIGTVHVDWDRGFTLGVAYREDEIRKL